MVNDQREKILQLIKMKGPVIPSQISKEINSSILLAGAMLSELVSTKKLKISHIKVGGTPVYYLPNQEGLLQTLSNRLNDKQRKAFELLRENKVLRDRSLQPVDRVSLREMKDFAIPLEVKIGENIEIFWKWYLTTNQDASPLINGILEQQRALEDTVRKHDEDVARRNDEERKAIERRTEELVMRKQETQKQQTAVNSIEHAKDGFRDGSSEKITASSAASYEDDDEPLAERRYIDDGELAPGNAAESKKDQKKEQKRHYLEEEDNDDKIIEQVKEMIKKERSGRNFLSKFVNNIAGMGKEKTAVQRQPEMRKDERKSAEHQEKLLKQEKDIKETPEKPEFDEIATDDFFLKLKRFFDQSKIRVMTATIMRKNSEIDFILRIPSAVGEIEYYCKAKNKKKCNDGDLSSVFVQSQSKKLPALFITTGDLTKRASDMLAKEFKNISFKKI